jgi:hypothetical protein
MCIHVPYAIDPGTLQTACLTPSRVKPPPEEKGEDDFARRMLEIVGSEGQRWVNKHTVHDAGHR